MGEDISKLFDFQMTLKTLALKNELSLGLHLSKKGHVSLVARINYLGVAIAIAYDREILPQGHVTFEDCLTVRMQKSEWCPNEIQFLRKR